MFFALLGQVNNRLSVVTGQIAMAVIDPMPTFKMSRAANGDEHCHSRAEVVPSLPPGKSQGALREVDERLVIDDLDCPREVAVVVEQVGVVQQRPKLQDVGLT